jgi:DNA polymerase III delta prime subunit
MSKILPLAARPRTLSGLFGQDAMVASIRSQMKDRQPQTWMFSGPSGTGKTTTAKIIAVAFNCPHMKLWGDPCDACWNTQKNFSIHDINASDKSGIDDMRRIVEMARVRSLIGAKRVFILNEAQRLTQDAQNCVLDPMEDPPSGTVWIVCTTEPQKIKITVRRRCAYYELSSLGITKREEFLTKYAALIQCKRPLDDLYEQVHLAQIGSPAMLLMALEKWAAGESALRAVAAGVEEGSIDSLAICKAVTNGDWIGVRNVLMGATPEQSRWIRQSVCGWLVGCMKRSNSGSDEMKAAMGLADLTAIAPLEDPMMLPWLWTTLHRVTKRYSSKG